MKCQEIGCAVCMRLSMGSAAKRETVDVIVVRANPLVTVKATRPITPKPKTAVK